jgi:hypothetical protein
VWYKEELDYFEEYFGIKKDIICKTKLNQEEVAEMING